MGRLTDKEIKSFKATGHDQDHSDGAGLYLRVTPAGGKYWRYRYKNASQTTHWLKLGPYPATSLAEARVLAAALKLKRNQGIDPIEERERERERQRQAAADESAQLAAKKARKTVRGLFDTWMEREGSQRKDCGSEAKRAFAKDVFPAIGDLPAADVRKGHISEILDKVKARGGNGRMAARLLSDMRQMFRFAVDRDFLESDPTADIRRSRIHKPTERDRVLSVQEIRELEGKLANARMAEQSQQAIFAMLATCCRVGELSKARLSDIDLEKRIWIIPPENSKNGREHCIYLSDFAISVFQELKTRAEALGSPWLLPARNKTDENSVPEHVCEKSLSKQIGDRQRVGKKPMKGRSASVDSLVLEGGKWTPHDLRRTGATMMVELGIAPDIVERCLNHTEQNKMRRIYQRHDYAPEMKAAWQALGKKLTEIANSDINNPKAVDKK